MKKKKSKKKKNISFIIFLILLFPWWNSSFADIQLTCASTKAAKKDLDGNIEYTELLPSHFTLISEDLGNNQVIARLFPNELETGNMSSPFLGKKTDSGLMLRWNSPKHENSYDILRIDRISGQFTLSYYASSDWFYRWSGKCWSE